MIPESRKEAGPLPSKGIQDKLKSIIEAEYGKLLDEWTIFGHPPDRLQKRNETVEHSVKEVFTDMIIEEAERRKQKETEIEELREKSKKLSILLKKIEPEILSRAGKRMWPLLKFETDLIELYKNLDAEKEENLKTFNKLNEEAKKIGMELAEAPPSYPAIEQLEVLPDESVIKALTTFVENMKREKKTREIKVGNLRKNAESHFKSLGTFPNGTHQRNILQLETILSVQLIADLTSLNGDLERTVINAQNERDGLCAKIESLSVRLERQTPVLPDGITEEAFAALKNLVTELEELKQLNIEKFIGKSVEKINELKARNFIQGFTEMPAILDDNSLDKLEIEIEQLSSYFEKNKSMIELVNKRWKDRENLLELELKALDPARLNNRGGALLRDQTTKKNLSSAIKRAEAKLKTWSGLIHGRTVEQMIYEEDHEFANKMEHEKQLKQTEKGKGSADLYTTMRKRALTPTKPLNAKRAKNDMSAPKSPGPRKPMEFKSPYKPTEHLAVPPLSPTYSEFSNALICQSTLNSSRAVKPNALKTPAKRIDEQF